jgi:eukaryotic-like serine/threonine-protein kinase
VQLKPGSELEDGRYRIVRLLARGGMGSVYEAENTASKKRVAVKCLHPARQDDPKAIERMRREAQASARVRHPNVVNVFDLGGDDEQVFLVMEYLEGETLKDALARRDLSIHAMIALLLPGMRGVAEAHARGVIHRDIKPDNIFLAREADTPLPVTKIIDFGISKLDDDEALGALTVTGVPIGTPFYMSYEQLAGRKDLDGRADVYSFGVVLYEALTGRRPYQAENLGELLCKMQEESPPPPEQLCPELPGTLSRLILWALEKDRDARISSMDQFVLELEPFATLHGVRAELARSAPKLELAATEPSALADARWKAALPSRTASNTTAAPVRAKAWLAAALLGSILTLASWPTDRDAQPSSAAPTREQNTQQSAQPIVSETSATLHEPPATPPTLLDAPLLVPEVATPTPARDERARGQPRGSPEAKRKLVRPAPSVPAELSPALSAAHARSQERIVRLTEQLASCGELRTRWLREQCRADYKREIADYEEQRELVRSVTGP